MNYEEKIDQFYDNWKKKHGSVEDLYGHNIYYLETRDREGNQTGEAFGLNCVTTYSMEEHFGISQPIHADMNRMYIGNGVTDDSMIPTPRDTAMRGYITGVNYSDYNSTRDYERFCAWDAENEVLWYRIYIMKARFDYVISGYDSPFQINEIGVSNRRTYPGSGSNWRDDKDHLSLHAAVYDINGERGYITKNPNEELYISLYATYAMKPQYVHQRFKSLGNHACFAMDPWAYNTRSEESIDSNSHGFMETFGSAYIAYPKDTEPTTSSPDRWYTGTILCVRAGRCSAGSNYMFTTNTMDSNLIVTQNYSLLGDEPAKRGASLIEDKNTYVDMCVFAGINVAYPTRDGGAGLMFSEMMAMCAPIRLEREEPINDVYMFGSSYKDNSITANYGYKADGSHSAYGTLPVVDYTPTSIKSYNGITHEWDIIETIQNSQNDYVLTSHFLYPWVLVRMATGIEGIGNNTICIWFNNWTEFPITSMSDVGLRTFMTDAWWNPSSWIEIVDKTNIAPEVGCLTYVITIGGARNTYYSYNSSAISNSCGTKSVPMTVERSGETIPGFAIASQTTSVSKDVDDNDIEYVTYAFPSTNSSVNPIAADVPIRRHIVSESREYIWMSNTVYYPEANKAYPIVSSYSSNIDMDQPIPSMRFTEPSGKRILQVFRSNNGPGRNTYITHITPKLSKVSVFEVSDNPNIAPFEYVVDLTGLPDNASATTGGANMIVTSTERGHVLFFNKSTGKMHIVDILGDAPYYEPKTYVLQDPTTQTDLTTDAAYAIQYTNYVVFRDTTHSDNTEYKFKIFDLSSNNYLREFIIPKAGTVTWIRGWNHYLYISMGTSTSSMTLGLYSMDELDPDLQYRVISTDSAMVEAFVPGGGFMDNSGGDYTNWRTWWGLTNTLTQGDEHCFFVYKEMRTAYSNDNNYNTAAVYYIDEDHPDEPLLLNIPELTYYSMFSSDFVWQNNNGTLSTHYYQSYSGLSFEVGSFNNNKQRIVIININGSQERSTFPVPIYYDLNRIRDERAIYSRTNSKNMATTFYGRPDDSVDKNNCGKYCSVMYKGKIVQCEYNTNTNTFSSKATLTTFEPNLVVPHLVSGTTHTIQCYNDPKKIYGMTSATLKYINSGTIWAPTDLVEAVDGPGE